MAKFVYKVTALHPALRFVGVRERERGESDDW